MKRMIAIVSCTALFMLAACGDPGTGARFTKLNGQIFGQRPSSQHLITTSCRRYFQVCLRVHQ